VALGTHVFTVEGMAADGAYAADTVTVVVTTPAPHRK
jgi:hypothetical protein